MLVRALWSYIFGCVIIKAKGLTLERFVSLAASAGVPLWDLERVSGDMMVLKVNPRRFKYLRTIARQCGVHVSVVKKAGLPFVIERLIRRRVLLAGAAGFLVALYFMSSYVWLVRVEGLETLDPEIVIEVAGESGLRPGVQKERIDLSAIESAIVSEISEVAWARVELRGVLAVVNVVEKLNSDEIQAFPGDVIAAKPGLIVEMTTLAGYPLVSVGDTVAAGQVLISGRARARPGAGDASDGDITRMHDLHADGIVVARVWYEGRGEAPVIRFEQRETGRKAQSYEVWIGKWGRGFGAAASPFSHYRTEVSEHTLVVRGFALPVRIVEKTYVETEIHKLEIDYQDARVMALQRAWEDVRRQVPEGVPPVKESVEVWDDTDGTNSWVMARVVVETRENIRSFRAVEQERAGSD